MVVQPFSKCVSRQWSTVLSRGRTVVFVSSPCLGGGESTMLPLSLDLQLTGKEWYRQERLR